MPAILLTAWSYVRRVPSRVWLVAAIAALLLFLVVDRAHQAQARRAAEVRAAVAEQNAVAARDTTRLIRADADRTLEARLAEQRALTAAERSELYGKVAGLEAALKDARRQPVGVIYREVAVEPLEGEAEASVRESDGVREASFETSVPGGTLSADVRLGPATGTALLRATIDPCLLTDVIATNRTTAEMYQVVEGRCTVRILGPPVLPVPAQIAVQPRPPLWRDGRAQAAFVVGAIAGGTLVYRISR